MKPIGLIIMDGFAYGAGCDNLHSNAVLAAHTPVLDSLWKTQPHTTLAASGEAVGLPEGQMGNSEVGHLNLGAGRCVYQELSRINRAIADGSLFENQVLIEAFDAAATQGATIHLLGLLSDGGVHSHISHLKDLIELAINRGAKDIAIHALLDGRDVSPTSGANYLVDLQDFIRNFTDARVHLATVMGRYYGMDRDDRWDRTERAYRAIVLGEGSQVKSIDVVAAIQDSYLRGITDEFVEPIVVVEPAAGGLCNTTQLSDNDRLIMFNFRPDRARQIMHSLTDVDFDSFNREGTQPTISAVCMTEYDTSLNLPIAFPKAHVQDTLSDVLSHAGLRQMKIAETEKYAHVTFFFNGGIETSKNGEERVLVSSPLVATYDLQPEMSAAEVSDALIAAIQADAADVYIVNYANGDMVGHTGDFDAAVMAVETVDRELGRVVDAFHAADGILLITADHGNVEHMRDDQNGGSYTAHTLNPVPLIVVGSSVQSLRDGGTLADVAPTVAHILGIEPSKMWTGQNL
ncbi:MAG: 2,3-bisphosphoglycerate-independent phosphoglycerate mutase, partial [Coriobacteriia bacterium]|nr:2,3-bisphosphoglycerate-independent phosphoglycerate mutase [Coriobacteriia bacterium]